MTAARLGKLQRTVVDAMQQGQQLNRFFEGGATAFFLEGHGEVPKDSIERLIARGLLKERQDAMFGVGMSFELTLSTD